MKYKEANILNISNLINSKEIINKARKNKNDFTRNRKITVKDLIYYALNKKGLSSKMELERFIEEYKIKDISTPGMLKQRQKLNPEVFRYLNDESLKLFYDNYQNEVKTFNGYLIMAIDGSDFEIPNTKHNKQEYHSPIMRGFGKISARAKISCIYDVLNNYVVDVSINPYKTNELKLMKENLKKAKQLASKFKIVRVMDRGYISLEDMYLSYKNNDKYIVKLRKIDFANERKEMQSDDEEILIRPKRQRKEYYETRNKELYNFLLEGNNIPVRIVNVKLPNGEIAILQTNLSKEEFSYEEIVELYKLRWKIEVNFNYLKNSMKIENITSSDKNIIEQDILSQMVVFNILQSIQNDIEPKIEQHKYKHKMKININMAVGYIKKYLIYILLQDDEEQRQHYMNILEQKILKNIIPVRPNRNFERRRAINNKHHINKRVSF